MSNLSKFLHPVLASAFAASVLLGAAPPASAATARNVVIVVDGAAVSHQVVRQGSIIRLANHEDNLNAIDVRVKSKHHVLRLITSYDKLINVKNAFPEGKQAAAVGFSRRLAPLGEVYTAVKPGKAVIVAEETRPSLGGIHAHFWHKIFVRVTR